MKKIATLLTILLVTLSCNKDDNGQNTNRDNPFLIDPLVSINLNLNLPEYDALKFPGNSVVINQQGIRGVIVYNLNNDLYTAFDLTDPNHAPNGCSRMEIEGVIARCPCTTDSNSYDIVTGQHQSDENAFPMQQYRAIRTGDNIIVSN